MHDKLPFDLERDFAPVGLVAETPMMIAVAPALGVKSLPELIAAAKARPDAIFYAANNRGSLPHLAGELFRSRAVAPVSFVPYPGAAAGLQDLAGGRVSMIGRASARSGRAAQAGTVKPLAVASAQRLPSLPDLPTAAETIPGSWRWDGWPCWRRRERPRRSFARSTRISARRSFSPRRGESWRSSARIRARCRRRETAAFVRAEQQAWRPRVREVGLESE